MTAKLSWHVQNIVVVYWSEMGLQWNLNNGWKIVIEMGPRILRLSYSKKQAKKKKKKKSTIQLHNSVLLST